MNILFATSFKNEQVASGRPRRVATVNNGATVNAATKVDANGYFVSIYNPANTDPNWYIEPTIEARRRYLSYSVRMTAVQAAQDAAGKAWQWVKLNIFGHEVLRGEVWPNHFASANEEFKFTVVQDTLNGTSKVYVGRRYVADGVVSNRLTWQCSDIAVARTWAAYITDLVIAESDLEEGLQVTMTDLPFTEIQNNWAYTGTDLAASVDKTNTTTLTPNAQVYKSGGKFTVEGSDKPVLIEGAGSTEGPVGVFGLSATSTDNPSVEMQGLINTQSLTSAIVEAGDEIEIQRVEQPLVLWYEPGDVTVTVSGNATVIWGDGSSSDLEDEGEARTFTDLGTLTIYGGDGVQVSGDAIVKVKQFGRQPKLSFEDCVNLEWVPTYIPSSLVDCEGMFAGCTKFNSDIQYWQVSNITNMDRMFQGATAFTGSLEKILFA